MNFSQATQPSMESSWFMGLATAVALALASYFLWWRWLQRLEFLRSSSRLPSPLAALPRWFGFIGGHSLLMKPGKAMEQVQGWAKEFGGDYELHLLGNKVICVTGLRDIRRILMLRPSKFKRGLGPGQIQWAGAQVGVLDSMFFEEGEAWGRSRRLISPNLNGHNVAGMLPIFAKIGERLCDKLGEQADKREVVPTRDNFARFTHDIIALAAFGMDMDSVRATAQQPCHTSDAITACVSTFEKLIAATPVTIWAWKFFPMLPWVRRTKGRVHCIKALLQDEIDAVRLRAKVPDSTADGDVETTGGTLLRRMIGAANDTGSSDRMHISDQKVMHETMSLFVAGTETTAISLSWAMYFLTKRPAAFLRCRAEALKIAPLSDGMVSTSEQLSQLEFCSAVFKEALRLKTPAPLLTFYGTEDFTLENGFVVEAGTAVVTLNRAASVSEEFFTRGEEFIPERWIDAEREEALFGKEGARGGKVSVNHEAEAFLAFGTGPRVCPGQHMAKAEGAVILAAICARFDIALAPSQADPPVEITAFMCGPVGMDMIFTRRKQED